MTISVSNFTLRPQFSRYFSIGYSAHGFSYGGSGFPTEIILELNILSKILLYYINVFIKLSKEILD